jgi:hypothetical protein
MVSFSPSGDEIRLPKSWSHVKQSVKSIIISIFYGDATYDTHTKAWLRVIGSILFYASDICVARQVFIQKSFFNGLIGLPIYYVAQMIIASTI